ncbi:MAG: SBBP repeat-containing protein [Bryobacteraceae bacterium]|nr:SBBP repeat-containing protein [Bryobacteraceae bacterium]
MRLLPLFCAGAFCAAAANGGVKDPRQAFSQLPAWFEPAPGQDAFVSRSMELALSVDSRGAVLARPGLRVRLEFAGAAAARLEALEPLEGRTNYLVGSDPSQWRRGVPHYRRVAARGVYPGIDVIYYSTGRQLEFDFVVAPGADPSRIALVFQGARPSLDRDGSLLLAGRIRQKPPVAYQMAGERRIPVASRYMLEGGVARIALGAYDPSLPLVIDPVIAWGGYFGGEEMEIIRSVAADPAGGFWIAGSSNSILPVVPNTDPRLWERNGNRAATTLAADVAAGDDTITVESATGFPFTPTYNIVIDQEEMTVTAIAGGTTWTVRRGVNGTTPAPHAKGAGVYYYVPDVTTRDAFLAKIMPDGDGWKVAYFTYLGGRGEDEATAIAMAGHRIAVTGTTASDDFPVSYNAFQPERNAQYDIFIVLYDPTVGGLDTLTFSTYYGGELSDTPTSIAVGPNGRIAVAGYTTSGFLKFMVSGVSLQPANRGGTDAFLVVADPFAPAPASFVYATYFGGSSTEIANAVGFDREGKVYVAGVTTSEDLPDSDNAHYHRPFSPGDGFILKIDPDKTWFDSFLYGGYWGGNDFDVITALQVAAPDEIYIAGYSFSDDLPVSPGAWQSSRRGTADAFVARLNLKEYGPGFTPFCTYFGGMRSDVPYSMALDPATGTVTLTGYTTSPDFPVRNFPGFEQPTIRSYEIFVTRFDPAKTGNAQLVWSTMFGGANADVGTGIALGADGSIFVGGYTTSLNLNIAGAAAKPNGLGRDAGIFIRIVP